MRSTIRSWAILLPWVTMSLCVPALAGCAIQPGPASRNDRLSAVSCLSADSCVAVGTEVILTGRVSEGWQSGTDAPMAMRWDGSRWHRLAARLPSGANGGTLASVSCKPGGCLAVGLYSTPPDHGTFPLAEYWNDSTWAPVTLALPPGPGDSSPLSAVSCVTARQCIATGDHEGANSGLDLPLATWDGHQWSWSRQPVPAGAWDSVALNSISCVTARYCVAVGRALNYTSRTGGAISFTETWNGQGWTYAPAPLATAYAAGLSCPAASHCVAVGTGTQHAGIGQLLDGAHWAQPAMPWPPGTQSSLYGVSCAAKTCLAVGAAGPSQAPDITANQPAALAWNGATWTWLAIPGGTSGTLYGILYGVTCVTAADCLAVGSAQDGNATRNLAEFWNGTAWTISNPA
jgi:hypothetical protein